MKIALFIKIGPTMAKPTYVTIALDLLINILDVLRHYRPTQYMS